jgi:hypothetical protein
LWTETIPFPAMIAVVVIVALLTVLVGTDAETE